MKIAKLAAIQNTLEKLINNCKNQKMDNECPIPDCLENEEFKLK